MKIWVVAVPGFDPVTTNRPAHLLGARCVNAPPILVETEACRVERQGKVIEQSPCFSFEILNESLILNAMDAAGRHSFKMPNRAYIVCIVSAQIRKISGVPGLLCPIPARATEWILGSANTFHMRGRCNTDRSPGCAAVGDRGLRRSEAPARHLRRSDQVDASCPCFLQACGRKIGDTDEIEFSASNLNGLVVRYCVGCIPDTASGIVMLFGNKSSFDCEVMLQIKSITCSI